MAISTKFDDDWEISEDIEFEVSDKSESIDVLELVLLIYRENCFLNFKVQ